MKTTFFSVLAALVGLAFFSGCGKSDALPPGTPPPEAINATEFRPSFTAASPEIKAVVDQVMMNLQGSLYTEALKGLAKLDANPALTEVQKKAVSELTGQTKKKMAAIAGPPK